MAQITHTVCWRGETLSLSPWFSWLVQLEMPQGAAIIIIIIAKNIFEFIELLFFLFTLLTFFPCVPYILTSQSSNSRRRNNMFLNRNYHTIGQKGLVDKAKDWETFFLLLFILILYSREAIQQQLFFRSM